MYVYFNSHSSLNEIDKTFFQVVSPPRVATTLSDACRTDLAAYTIIDLVENVEQRRLNPVSSVGMQAARYAGPA